MTPVPSPAHCPCSFLLQLSLLDLPCSGYTASLRAAAALSAALAHYGLPEWPAQLQAFGSYTLEEIVPCRQVRRQSMAPHDSSCGGGTGEPSPHLRLMHAGQALQCVALTLFPSPLRALATGPARAAVERGRAADAAALAPAARDARLSPAGS